MSEFGGIIPVLWQVEPWAAAEVEIILNWLELEIECGVEQRLPITAHLAGWRNREVHDYVKQEFENTWDERIIEELYGNMPFYHEMAPSWMKEHWL